MLKKLLVGLVLIFALAAPTSAASDYYLPYPGALPDHPLYWLKMVRDRIQLLLTTNTLAKAEKLLLYADKRLGAGWALVEGNKQALGMTTLTKAEKYLYQAVALGENSGLKETLKKAVQKHEEVLTIVKDKVSDEFKNSLQEMITRDKNYEAGLGIATEVKTKIDFGDNQVVTATVSASTALEALENASSGVKVKDYDWGKLVEEVTTKKNTPQKAWIYFVNGEAGKVAADKQEVKAGDIVEWRYEKPIY
ncbi:MAG: DUF5667 domain-containing protein [Candidatus Beckwithbacteria bacterium]|nr:DUF5667 domain-containing protein [Candidatus Beckwithbacteria bacterium]